MDIVKAQTGHKTFPWRLFALALAVLLAFLSGCSEGIGAANGEPIPKEPVSDGRQADPATDIGEQPDTDIAAGDHLPNWLKCRSEVLDNGDIGLHYSIAATNSGVGQNRDIVTITIQKDGAKKSEYQDGTQVIYDADGNLTVEDLTVNVVSEIPDAGNRITFTTRDGTRMTKQADGQITMVFPDQSVGVYAALPLLDSSVRTISGNIRYPGGMTSRLGSNGKWTFISFNGRYTNEDNACRWDLADGTQVLFQASGRIEATYPNGAKVSTNGKGALTVEYRGVTNRRNRSEGDDQTYVATLKLGEQGDAPKTEIVQDSYQTVYAPGGVTVMRYRKETIVRYPDGVETKIDQDSKLIHFVTPDSVDIVKQIPMPDQSSETESIPASSDGIGSSAASADRTTDSGGSDKGNELSSYKSGQAGSVLSQVVMMLTIFLLIVLLVLVMILLVFQMKKRQKGPSGHSTEGSGNSTSEQGTGTNDASPAQVQQGKVSSKTEEQSQEEDDLRRDTPRKGIYLGYPSRVSQISGTKSALIPKNGGELRIYRGSIADTQIEVYPSMQRIANAGEWEGYIDSRNLENGPVRDCFKVLDRTSYTGAVLQIQVDQPAVLKRDGEWGNGELRYFLYSPGRITVVGVK